MILLPLVEEQFQSEIKLCYQKRDSLYADLVTVKPVPVGDRTYFNRSHAGTPAGQKARFGKIPRNGGSLDRVPCDLETYYAGDEIDEQEVSSTSANGMLVITDNAVASMNQRVDELILNAINSTTQTVTGSDSDIFTLDCAKEIWNHFQKNHVFKNRELPIVNVGVNQWNQLMDIKQFYHADAITMNDLPYLFTKAETGRFWMDMVWRVDPDLESKNGKTKCNAFVKSCVGLALGGVDKVRVRETDDDTILYYMRRKFGTVLIDETGALAFEVKDTATSASQTPPSGGGGT